MTDQFIRPPDCCDHGTEFHSIYYGSPEPYCIVAGCGCSIHPDALVARACKLGLPCNRCSTDCA